MEKYLFIYLGGKVVSDQKARDKMMADWTKWFGGMGKAVVDMGAPAKPEKLVSAKGVKSAGDKPVSGYSIVQADSLDAAVALAKTCPIIAEGGELAISTIMPM